MAWDVISGERCAINHPRSGRAKRGWGCWAGGGRATFVSVAERVRMGRGGKGAGRATVMVLGRGVVE